MNETPEGIEVVTGQLWRDLDKRMRGRVCRVGKVAHGKAQMFTMVNGQAGKFTMVSIRRMRKTSTGWALVEQPSKGQP